MQSNQAALQNISVPKACTRTSIQVAHQAGSNQGCNENQPSNSNVVDHHNGTAVHRSEPLTLYPFKFSLATTSVVHFFIDDCTVLCHRAR